MPGMDGTGPMGMGPMTGGGRGWCNPYYGGIRPPMSGFPYPMEQVSYRPWGWGIPYGVGTVPLNPYGMGFRTFPFRPFGCARGRGRRRG